MSVYVDDMYAPYGRMKMCHMIADTHEELVEMVDRIKLSKKWIQDKGTYREHFDIGVAKRKLAVNYGAQEVSVMDLGRIIHKRELDGG